MKKCPNLLDDWTEYNRRTGVDMLYILYNAAIGNQSEKYAHRTEVDVIYWPFQRLKVQDMSLLPISACNLSYILTLYGLHRKYRH